MDYELFISGREWLRGLSVRTGHIILSAGFASKHQMLEAISSNGANSLKKIYGIGPSSKDEILEWLSVDYPEKITQPK